MLVLITPPATSTSELALLPALFRSGLRTLHVRKPGASRDDLQDYVSRIPREYRDRIVLHQHHDLAPGLGGIHYRNSDLPEGSIAATAGLTTSVSLHALADLGVCRGAVDYCLLAPVYGSISKPGHGPPPELADRSALSSGVRASRTPVLALGGVGPQSFEELADWGFAGAALLGAVWQAEDPVASLEEALEASRTVAWDESGLSCSTA